MFPDLTPVYLAGKIGLKEAVPLLRQLEDSTYCGSHVHSSSDYEPRQGDLDPSSYSEMTLRSIVHLSLRRLGAVPRQYPCTQFSVGTQQAVDIKQPFDKVGDKQSRTDRVSSVKPGMKPENVLARIGAPDFVTWEGWCYDIDAQPPFTLTILWEKGGAGAIQQHRPAFWKSEKWDEEIAY